MLELRESVEKKQRYIILISRLSKMEHSTFLSGGAEYEITMDASGKM